ncbi:helix-turn-helix domain-containing protein [Anaerosolibacter sp.]|uniref:helix-turn-helix domain-containing protein n=1 Tax=Anaerosolibacter sp. TaxID=1872527 RepID=UPI0039F14515
MTDKGKMIEAVYKASLTKRATLVIFYLINRANKELTCFPGIKTIAFDCNMSDRTVRRALDDLVESGYVKKEARYRENGGQSSNLYTLMFDVNNEAVEREKETCHADVNRLTGEDISSSLESVTFDVYDALQQDDSQQNQVSITPSKDEKVLNSTYYSKLSVTNLRKCYIEEFDNVMGDLKNDNQAPP